jgi:hypothetical protein
MKSIYLSVVSLLVLGACSAQPTGYSMQINKEVPKVIEVGCVSELYKPLFAGQAPQTESSKGLAWPFRIYEAHSVSWKTDAIGGVDLRFAAEWRGFDGASDQVRLSYYYDEAKWKTLGRMQRGEFEEKWELRKTVLYEMMNGLTIRCGVNHDKNDLRGLCLGEVCKQEGFGSGG